MMIESGAVSKSFPVFLPGARRRRVFFFGRRAGPRCLINFGS